MARWAMAQPSTQKTIAGNGERIMRITNFIVVAILLMTAATISLGQSSAFTYQGRFNDGGAAANGTYEMQFKLFDAVVVGTGNQIGGTVTGPVTVTNGVFTVLLNYGAAAFPGADRFLEISVRPSGSGDPFTTLSPRQYLSSSVYAIRAGSADNATQLGGVASGQYVQTNDSRLTTTFNISGDGTAGGTLSGDTVNAVTQYNLAGKRLLGAISLNNTFVGIGAGDSSNTISQNNTFVGRLAGHDNTTGANNTIVGSFAGTSATSSNNSIFGAFAGELTTTGASNSFFGSEAGYLNKTASDNSYFGNKAGYSSTGGANAMFGSNAGASNTTGFANSFVGKDTGSNNAGGFENTFIGRNAGSTNVSGNDNTILGTNADVASGGLSYATAIGAGAKVGTSNTIVLGRNNDGVQVPGTFALTTLGAGGITSLCRNVLNQISTCSSSLRYKKNLQPFTRGLTLLNQLKPITFQWKADDSNDLGFGAEDIAAVEPLLVTRNDKGEVEGVKYDRITAVLVNAVKEQQEQISRQQSQLVQQQQQVEELKRLVSKHARQRQTRATSYRGR